MNYYKKCKNCNATIIFIRTSQNQTVPCDAEPRPYAKTKAGKDRVILIDGEIIAGNFAAEKEKSDGYGYKPHFETCQEIDKFKKPRKSKK